MYSTYWDYISLCIYLAQAIIGMVCLKYMIKNSGSIGYVKNLAQLCVLGLLLVWTLMAAFRLVGWGIGGTDALGYIQNFNDCLTPSKMSEHSTGDICFLWMQQIVKRFTDNYHIYFIVVSGFIAIAIVTFIKRFNNKIFCSIPLVLAFYLYLRGYNTLRSNMAIAFILLGLVSVADKHYKYAYFFMLCSLLTHKAGILYAMSIPYLHIAIKRGIKPKYIAIVGVSLLILVPIVRDRFIEYTSMNEMNGAYGSYARSAMENNDWSSGLTENFMQYLLSLIVIVSTPKIRRVISNCDMYIYRTVNMLLYICYFDMMMIPFNVMMGIWRGYEFFYIPRLCMWGVVIYVYTRKMGRGMKGIAYFLIFAYFIAWFVFRLNRTYEASDLMPYILDVF